MPQSKATVMLAVALVAATAVGAGRMAWTAVGETHLRDDPSNPRVAAAALVGNRPLADRNGVLVADTTTEAPTAGSEGGAGDGGGSGAPRRRVLIPAGELLVRLADANLAADVQERSTRGFFGERVLDPLALSIDVRIQAAAAEALAGRHGVAVALDDRTGEVLALAAVGVDPDGGLRASAPGSVAKLVTYSAALSTHDVSAFTRFPVESGFAGITNDGGAAIGGTLREVVALSSNAAAERAAFRASPPPMNAAAEKLGVSGPAPLAGVERPGWPELVDERPQDLAQAAIGQGSVRIDPITAARLAGAVVGDGLRPGVRLTPGMTPPVRVIDAGVLAPLADGMKAAVAMGTARGAALPGVAVAAKTGTAERADGGSDGWCVAVAPAAGSHIAVAVVLYGDSAHQLSGHNAAPAAGKLLGAAMRFVGAAPAGASRGGRK